MEEIGRESGPSGLVPDFNGISLSFSPFNLILAIDLLYIGFIVFKYVPFFPDFRSYFKSL